MKIRKILRIAIKDIEEAPITLSTFVVGFCALILARLVIENALGLFEARTFFFFFFEFTHTFLFFLCSFLLILPIVRFAGGVDFKKGANILFFGFLIILTPPMIDTFIFHGTFFWSFYEFDGLLGLIRRFFTLFGDTPDIGITYGVRVEVVAVTLLLGFYTYIKSHRIKKALLVSLSVYSLLFILGTFPSWITLFLLSFQKGLLSISQSDVAALFLTPEHIFARNLTDFRSVLNVKMSLVFAALSVLLVGKMLWSEQRAYFIALWHNARIPQMIWHGGLLFLGMGLAFVFTDAPLTFDFFHITGALVLLATIESAWIASVIANDIYDTNIDTQTNPNRPLIQATIPMDTYKIMGILFFITSLLFAGILSFTALLLVLCYQALAWLYSAPPLRLKRFPGIATLIAACAGLIILVTGFLAVSPEHSLHLLPLSILSFLFVSYALCIPLKDFKDIEGDALDHVYTLPVIFGARITQLILGSLFFILFVLSPLVLSARSLSPWALLFGGLAFWTLEKGNDDEQSFFAFRKLPRIIVTIVACYGFMIAVSLF